MRRGRKIKQAQDACDAMQYMSGCLDIPFSRRD